MSKTPKWLIAGMKHACEVGKQILAKPYKSKKANLRKFIKLMDLNNHSNPLVRKFVYHGILDPQDMVELLLVCAHKNVKFNEEVRKIRQRNLPPGCWDCGLKC